MSKLIYATEKELVDKKIIPFLNAINNTDLFYTTSSCYGRITVDASDLKISKKTHAWIMKHHEKIEKTQLHDALKKENEGIIWIRQLPFILHIYTKDIDCAQKLLVLAKKQGLKKCAIFQIEPRIFIQLKGEDVIEIPAKYKNKLLVNENELEKITEILNHSFSKNEERLSKLFCEFKDCFDN
ncbi:MAG: hypothetical protein KAR87_06070 [Candidatus Aenigmarchaeota archaeon]|nr:hypothetical protein [Candidatus Aenigmarchaeota archaeon]